jgi:hypothetical protein
MVNARYPARKTHTVATATQQRFRSSYQRPSSSEPKNNPNTSQQHIAMPPNDTCGRVLPSGTLPESSFSCHFVVASLADVQQNKFKCSWERASCQLEGNPLSQQQRAEESPAPVQSGEERCKERYSIISVLRL